MADPREPSRQAGGPDRLQGRVARGLTWTVVDTWGRQLLNLAVFVVLARLLVPEDFGLVALATVFVALAQLVVDQGLGDALIQRREITGRQIDTAFWVALATGAVLTVVGIALAVPIAAALGEPELQPILQVLSVTFVLSALSSIPIALLRRELAFRSLAMRAIVAAVVGGALGIGMAVAGFGAWALVGQQVATAAASVLVLWRVTPWRPERRWSRSDFGELFGFGANILGSDLLNYLSRNVDNLLIGAFLGTGPLGLYAVAYRILTITQTMLINVARKLAFPMLSQLQGDRPRMVRAYIQATRVASIAILPGYIGLAVAAPELVVAFFGTRWSESGPVASVLFLIGPVLTVQAFSGAMLSAAGRPDVLLRFRLVTAVVNVAGFLVAVQFGILAVAAAFVARGYLLLPLNLRWLHRHADVPVAAYLAPLRGIAVATLAMAGAMLAVRLVLVDRLAAGPLLALEAAVGAAVLVAGLVVLDRALLREAADLARSVAGGRRRRGGGARAGDAPPDPDDGMAPAP